MYFNQLLTIKTSTGFCKILHANVCYRVGVTVCFRPRAVVHEYWKLNSNWHLAILSKLQ